MVSPLLFIDGGQRIARGRCPCQSWKLPAKSLPTHMGIAWMWLCVLRKAGELPVWDPGWKEHRAAGWEGGAAARVPPSRAGAPLSCRGHPRASPFLGRSGSVLRPRNCCQSLRKHLRAVSATSQQECRLKKKKSSFECIYLEYLWKSQTLTKLVLLILLANSKKWGHVMNVVFLMVI